MPKDEDQKKVEKIISEGGIYWRCADCGMHGVIKAEFKLAKLVRKASGIATGPCGYEFTKEDCPKCGPNPVRKYDG